MRPLGRWTNKQCKAGAVVVIILEWEVGLSVSWLVILRLRTVNMHARSRDNVANTPKHACRLWHVIDQLHDSLTCLPSVVFYNFANRTC